MRLQRPTLLLFAPFSVVATTLSEIGCPECDLLTELPSLTAGQSASCPRCGFILTVCYADPANRAMSFAVAGLVLLAVAVSFPFLTITSAGIKSSVTLYQSISSLASYGANTIAILIFFIIILIPAAMLAATVLLTLLLSAGRFPDWMLPVTRWLFHFNAWAMVEVFSIAVIVSLVKIASMARFELGLSFWAYLAFSAAFLLAFSSLDRLTIWDKIHRTRFST